MYLIWRARGRRIKDPNLPPRWGLLYAYACLAGVSHILLDFTNNYGVRPFWPFSERWISWDIVYIVEPVILLVLVLGLIVPGLSSLINEEIGARRKGPPGRLAATVALLAVFLYWGVRDYEHRRAVAALESRIYKGADPVRASAYPYMITPFRWHGVVETASFFASMDVDSLVPEVDPGGQMQTLYKPEETPVTLAAKQTYLGRVYLSWAKYPITETEQRDDDRAAYVVRFRDLRYAYPGRDTTSMLGAKVFLNRDLQVLSEQMGTRSSATRVPDKARGKE
jgi:inner membrane protein